MLRIARGSLAGSFVLLGCATSAPASAVTLTSPSDSTASLPATAAAETHADVPQADGMVTVRGKSSPIEKTLLSKEGGEFFFYADDANGEGVGIRLGADVREGAKIQRNRGVVGHLVENGSKANVGDSSSFTFEVTKLELGSWEKPGKCSGSFEAEVQAKDDVIKASGPFVDIDCYGL